MAQTRLPNALAVPLFCILIIACAFSGTLALYGPKDGVVSLTAANFDKLVMQSDGVAAVRHDLG